MPLPDAPDYNTEHLDSPTDVPELALPALKGSVEDLIALISMLAQANGVATLNADGIVPDAQLGNLAARLGNAINALAALTPAEDRLPYFTGANAATLATLGAFGRAWLALANDTDARVLLGTRIGLDIAAFSTELEAFRAAIAEALVARIDSEGNGAPRAGVASIDESGQLAFDPAPPTILAAVNAAIAQALETYSSSRNLDDYVTATEAALEYLPIAYCGDAGLEVLAVADWAALRVLLAGKLGGSIDNTGSTGGNYERVGLEWVGNVARLVVSKAGSGVQRDLAIDLGGTTLHLRAVDGALVLEVAGQTAGNTRGSGAIDLQTSRVSATRVASGPGAVCIGDDCAATGTWSSAIGSGAKAAAAYARAFGSDVLADRRMQIAFGFGGDLEGGQQWNTDCLGIGTGNNAQTEMWINNITNGRLLVATKALLRVRGTVQCAKNDSTGAAAWDVSCAVYRAASGTVSMLGTPAISLVGASAGLDACSVALSADDANKALAVKVTGLSGVGLTWKAFLHSHQLMLA